MRYSKPRAYGNEDCKRLTPLSLSELNGGPGWVWRVPWIGVSWIRELSIVVFGIKGSSGSLSDSDELINVLLVGEVLVKVILEVLDHVHVLLNKIVSSDFLEWEGLIVELIGGDGNLRVLTHLLEGSVDLHGVVVVGLVEGSGELGELEFHLFLGLLKREWALSSEDFVVDNFVREWVSGVAFLSIDLYGRHGGESQNSKGESHIII